MRLRNMANRIENGGNSWWSCFCCCADQSPQQRAERDPLVRPINDAEEQGAQPRRQGSPQPSYSNYQTAEGATASPLK